MNQKKLTPLFAYSSISYIKYAESLDKLHQCQFISKKEFAKNNHFTWTESSLVTEDKYDYITNQKNNPWLEEIILKNHFSALIVRAVEDKITMAATIADYDLNQLQKTYSYCYSMPVDERIFEIKLHLRETEQKLDNHLANLRQDLVICKLNETIGHGVFLAPDAKPINKNEIVAFYTGTYKNFAEREDVAEYAFDIPNHIIFANKINRMEANFPSGFIDAKMYGNISRFFQDLPTAEEIQELYKIPTEEISNIATANIRGLLTYYHNIPVIYLLTTRDIQPGEQLGFSYGKGYWARAELIKDIKRCLFYKNGTLAHTDSFINYLNLAIDKHYYSFSITKLKQHIKHNLPLSFTSKVNAKIKKIEIDANQLSLICAEHLANLAKSKIKNLISLTRVLKYRRIIQLFN